VPKALALDVTTRCNKEKPCKACYPEVSAKDPSFQSLEGILDGADHLGFSSVAILGGEPLVRKDLLPLLETHPDLYYFVFTNGIDLDQETVNKFKASKARTFFFVHIQGTQELTDEYMEPGDFEKQQKAMTLLNQARMPFGIVTTLDRNNIDLITNDNFLRFLGSQRQCVIAAYFHYISMGHNPKPELELTPQQKQDLKDMDSRFKRMAPPYMINPETIIGQDCVAGGYIHVNAKGAIAPCVFLEPSRDDKGMYATGESFEQAFMNSKVTKACQGIQHDQGHYGGCLRTVRRSEYLGLLDKIAI
jgi:MoaA/NifB/PqqE/SkfB family radical SAM enzyme